MRVNKYVCAPRVPEPQHCNRTRASVWSMALGAGTPPLPCAKPACKHTVYVPIPTLSPKHMERGWQRSSVYKAVGTECGASLRSPREGPHPLTQRAPGPSSDLELPVTYFPLLLFLEVLMSMQNSAEAE